MNRFDVKAVTLAPSTQPGTPQIHVTYNDDEKLVISITPKAALDLVALVAALMPQQKAAPQPESEKPESEKQQHSEKHSEKQQHKK